MADLSSALDKFVTKLTKLESALSKVVTTASGAQNLNASNRMNLAGSTDKRGGNFLEAGLASIKESTIHSTLDTQGRRIDDDGKPMKRRVATFNFNAQDEDNEYSGMPKTAGTRGMRKWSKKLGLDEARFGADDYGLTKADTEHNIALQERARDKVFGKFGMDRNSLAQLSNDARSRVASAMPTIQDTISTMSGIQNAMGTFMPNVGNTINRAAGYYQATLANGNSIMRNNGMLGTGQSVQDLTFDTMGKIGGITSVGSDAAVAQILSGAGMSIQGGSALTGRGDNTTYQQTIRSVAHAGRYLNMDNASAAQAISGLTSGTGSAQTLKNFGIYTSDLSTGKEKTQGQIFEELAGRLTAGRPNADLEQTQASLRRGTLGATANSFFGEGTAQNTLFRQYMIDRAGKGNMDLSSESAMTALYGKAAGGGSTLGKNANPLGPQMELNVSDTAQLQKAEANYITGMHTATQALKILNEAAGTLAGTIGGLPNALMQTLSGHTTTQGLFAGINTITQHGSKSMAAQFEALMMGEYGLPTDMAASAAQQVALGVTSAATWAPVIGMMAAQGAAGFAGMLGSGSIMNNGGTGANDGILHGGGQGGVSTTSTSGMANAEYAGSKISTHYGGSTFANGNHGGIDYTFGEGKPVKAIAAGKVIKVIDNPNNNYAEWNNYQTKKNEITGKYGGSDNSAMRSEINKLNKPASSLGTQVHIQHLNGYVSIYGHLQAGKVKVKQNDIVEKGQIIGYLGNTGTSSGAHLHLQLERNGQTVDPEMTKLSELMDTTGVQEEKAAVAGATQAAAAGKAGSTFAGSSINPASLQNAAGLAQDFFSGNTSKILSAVYKMAGVTSATPGITGLDGGYTSSLGAGVGGSGSASTGGSGSPVTINVAVANASDAEAIKFANTVKRMMESDNYYSSTGSR